MFDEIHSEQKTLSLTTSSLTDTTLTFPNLLQYMANNEVPLKNSYIPSGCLLLVALASAWMYVVPSWKAGQREGGDAYAYLQLIGNTVGAGLIVINIGDYYVDRLQAAQDILGFKKFTKLTSVNKAVSEQQSEIIPQSRARCCNKTMSWLHESQLHILFLAAFTALPYGAAAYFYPDFSQESEELLWVKTVLTFLVNTVSHTLPISLMLNVPWLNALLVKIPTAPYLATRHIYRQCAWTEPDWELMRAEQKKISKQVALRQQVTCALQDLIALLQTHGFKRIGGFRFAPSLPDDFKQLLDNLKQDDESEKAALNLLPIIQNHYAKFAPKTSALASNGFWLSLYNGMKMLFGAGGGALVGISISGFLKVNYDLFYRLFGDSYILAAICMLGPAVTSEVLAVYFGYLAFSGAYEYLMTWLTGHPHAPYAFKLNPILSTFFLGFIAFLCAFGYGTALQLTHDTFDPETYGETLCTLLEMCAKWGLITYGAINFTQLLDKIVEPLARRFGSVEQREFVELLNLLRRLAALLDQLDPELLKRTLNTIDDEKTLAVLGLEKDSSGDVQPIAPALLATAPAPSDKSAAASWSLASFCHGCCQSAATCCSNFWTSITGGGQPTKEDKDIMTSLLPPLIPKNSHTYVESPYL